MVIGEDVAICRYDDTRAEAVGEFALFELATALGDLGHAVETAEQFFERVLGATAHDADHAGAGDGDYSRANLLKNGGVAGVEGRAVKRTGIYLKAAEGWRGAFGFVVGLLSAGTGCEQQKGGYQKQG